MPIEQVPPIPAQAQTAPPEADRLEDSDSAGASSWRGKFVVLALLGAAAALLVYSLWFVNSHTPIDERFNMRRRPLADDTPGPLILRERAGDYLRASLEVDTLDQPGAARHGIATYKDFDGKPFRLEVQRISGERPTIAALFADFPARSGGDRANSSIRLHDDGPIHYGYGVYSGPTYAYYEFTWINGNWILRASTRDTGSEALLRFVNSYVY